MSHLHSKVASYLFTSYHRKQIDHLLSINIDLFSGLVLDIGGRKRGSFIKPKTLVTHWIFADINPAHQPDLVLDVASMTAVGTETIDVISACELFEHVEKIDEGLDECYRVLKRGGRIIITVPFLYPIHADPDDFQRWTETKWKQELRERHFELEKFSIIGRYFTVLCDQIKFLVKALPVPFKYVCALVSPLLDLLVLLDRTSLVLQSSPLKNTHGGYFIVAKKV